MSTQSLPSFAQAFSAIPPTDALPPIMHNRKRAQDDAPDDDDHVRVKEELDDDDPAPPPSALMPAPKKRRVTVSGAAPQPLHIDVRPPHDHQPASTPISPVVIGFPVHRDNPAAMEQVRNMISVKQKQKALIEQRRGSAAGILSPAPPHTPADDRPPIATPPSSHPAPAPPAPAPTPRSSRRSPNHPPTRRTNPPRAPSPPVPTSHHHHPPPPPVPQHSLPPPPISFARRRAAQLGGKRKPADIVISPREAHTRDQLQPAIQSAPPIPQAGAAQGQFSAPRFTMALPRLPTITGNENPRRVAGNVPPTPTRLSMLQHQPQTQHQPPSHAGAQHPQPPHAHIQGQQGGLHPPMGLHPASALGPGGSGPPARSPPASIPIATTLVPPTPTTLTRTGSAYARAGDSDKAAFLAPFELFYEALSDARTLKGWLGDQLRESRALLSSLGTAQERRQESIDAAVERRLAGVHAEMAALRRRVEELEATNRDRDNNNLSNNQAHRQINGGVDAYTFPPQSEAGPSRMRGEPRRPPTPSSGGWEQRERESPQMGRRSVAGRDTPLAGEYKDHRDREREYADREREREREARSSRRNSIAMDGDGDEDSQMRHT